MINVIITSYNEPNSTIRAVTTFLNQAENSQIKITIVDPFPEVETQIKKLIKDKRVEFFLDPGEGKAYALNILFQELWSDNKEDFFILSDGDVFVSQNALEEITKKFQNPKIGCVTGKPVSIDSENTKYGFWAKVAFKGVDKVRKKLSEENKFFECSGYLFAIRNSIITEFPIETSEDSIIPYLFWKKGYKIAYADKAEVYVKNPDNWKDWINQRTRNIKAHENLTKIAPNMPRTKSLFNEIKFGTFFALTQWKNPRELLWTLELFPARLYIYLKAFKDLRQKKAYKDGWRETEINSTKTLD